MEQFKVTGTKCFKAACKPEIIKTVKFCCLPHHQQLTDAHAMLRCRTHIHSLINKRRCEKLLIFAARYIEILTENNLYKKNKVIY